MKSLDLSSSKEGYDSWTTKDYVYITAEAVVGLLTIVVNGLVLAALWRYPILRTVTNCYVGSLAVADVLVGLLVAPLVIVSYTGLPREFYACLAMNSFVGMFVGISILSIVGVAFDRYWAILHPVARLNVATKRGALKMVAALWTLGTVIGLVPLMGWHNDPEGFDTCSYRRVIVVKYNVYLRLFGFRFSILFAMLYVHVRIYYAMKRANMSMAAADSASRRSSEERRPGLNVRLFRSMVLIFTMYALCWVPISIVNCIELWSPETPVHVSITTVSIVLTHSMSFVNPLLYVVSQPGFRRVIRLHLPACLTVDTEAATAPSPTLTATPTTVTRTAVASPDFSAAAGLTETCQEIGSPTDAKPITQSVRRVETHRQ